MHYLTMTGDDPLARTHEQLDHHVSVAALANIQTGQDPTRAQDLMAGIYRGKLAEGDLERLFVAALLELARRSQRAPGAALAAMATAGGAS